MHIELSVGNGFLDTLSCGVLLGWFVCEFCVSPSRCGCIEGLSYIFGAVAIRGLNIPMWELTDLIRVLKYSGSF